MASPTRITRLPDRQLVKLAKDLAAALSAAQFGVHYGGGVSLNVTTDADLKDYSSKSYAIQCIRIAVPETRNQLRICRGRYNSTEMADVGKFERNRESAPFDEYMIFNDQSNFTKEQVISIESILSQHQAHSLDGSGVDGDLSAIVSAQLEQLRQLALDFSERQMAAEERLERAYRKREDALNKRAESEETKIDRLRQKVEAELSEERRKIEAWRSEINDREPQHERRRLRESLTSDLRQFAKDPPARSANREWISNAAYLMVGGFLW